MAPSVMAFVLLAIFHVSHGVENGNQDAPSPPPDKMKALSSLAATLHRGPTGPSAPEITGYCKIAMVELQVYAAALVDQGGSVVKKDVRLCGEIATGLVRSIENTLGTDLKLFKISPAQKETLDRALSKIEATTPNHAQSLDKLCQGAKNVMDDLALEGYAQATGCILVMKDLIRKIQQLSAAHQDQPQKSEGTPVVVSRKLSEDPIEISTLPATESGDTATGSPYPSLNSICGYANENAFLYSFEAPSAVILDLKDLSDSSIHGAAVIDQAGDCIYACESFLPCAFLTTAGQIYRILVFAQALPGGFELTIRSEDIADPQPIEVVALPAEITGNTDLPSNGGTGGLYTGFFGTPCGGFLPVYYLSVLHTFEASDPVTRFETCGSEFDTGILYFQQDGSCIGGTDRFIADAAFVREPYESFGLDGCFWQEDTRIRTTPGQTYFILVTSFVRAVGPYTLRVTGIPAPGVPAPASPGMSSSSWCEKVTPLEYSLSGKGKKKAIKACLKYHLIGDSALPQEIGQIGLTSPGMLGLAGGLGLMALVAVMAVVLKRRLPAKPHWVPVPEAE